MEGLQDFGVYQEISENDVKERGLKVIDSRLVLKEKNGGVKARLCEGIRAHQERTICMCPTPGTAIVRTLLTRTH